MAQVKEAIVGKGRGEIVSSWVEAGILTPAEHAGIMHKIGVLQRANRAIPLQYSLYRELANNNGELPEYLIGDDRVMRQKKETIEAMVPDVAASIYRLEEANLKVITDPHNELSDPTVQRIMAGEMSRTIRNTYPANRDFTATVYPLKEGIEGPVAEQMGQGIQDTFAVMGEDGMMAVFSNVRKHDVLNRPHLIELGRTGIDQRYRNYLEKNHLNMRGVSQLRLLQIFCNKEYRERFGDPAKAAYMDARIKKEDYLDPETNEVLFPGGRGVQGVFWGGVNRKNHPVDLGFGVWGVGRPYKLDKMEPFLRAGQWLDQERALEKLEHETIWVPNQAAKDIVTAYLSSFSPQVERFNVRVLSEVGLETHDVNPTVSYTNNGETVFSAIDVIDATEQVEQLTSGIIKPESIMSFDEAIARAYEAKAPYIETYVECTTNGDGNTMENAVRLNDRMQALINKGFVVTGFTPTDKGNGGIRLTFALITKQGLDLGLYEHHFPPEYYQGNRMEKAINAAEFALQNLEDHSRKSPLNV